MESGSGFLINSTSLNTTDGPPINAMFVLARISSTIQLILCGLVLFVFYRLPSVRTEINYPIVNLVASDILRATLSYMAIPLYFMKYSYPSASGEVYCVMFRYMNNIQLAWSGWAIVLVAYSRYDNVTNVFSPKLTRKRFWTLTVTSWIVSLLTSLPPIIGWSSYSFRKMKNMHRCATGSIEKDWTSATFLPFFYFVNYGLPSAIVLIVFSRIACISISRQIRDYNPSNDSKLVVLSGFALSAPRSTEKDRQRAIATHFRNIIKSKSFLYVVIIVVTNILFSAPYVVVTSYDTVSHDLGLHKKIPHVAMEITTVLFKLNFNVNSLLYIFWIKTFQNAAGALCCRKDNRNASAAGNNV